MKNEAPLVDYANSVDRTLNVQVMRCMDWQNPLEKTNRMGYGVPHVDEVLTTALTKYAWRVDTWKGSRIKILEPYYPDPPKEYVQVNVPCTFSFRWSELGTSQFWHT